MLAHALGRRFGSDAELVDRATLDITDADSVTRFVSGRRLVVNTAAYTAVDDAEKNEGTAFDVNATGAENIARACAAAGARLVHVSTDYVFDGRASTPYASDAATVPVSAYGRTKLAGERAVLAAHPTGAVIARTAWLYGAGGRSFVDTMVSKAREGAEVSVVTDQIGQPTWTVDLAARIDDLADVTPGVYHATNAGACSWFDLTVTIYRELGVDSALVSPTTSDQFVRPAPRPAWSVLGDDAAVRAGIAPMRSWDIALAEALRVDFAV